MAAKHRVGVARPSLRPTLAAFSGGDVDDSETAPHGTSNSSPAATAAAASSSQLLGGGAAAAPPPPGVRAGSGELKSRGIAAAQAGDYAAALHAFGQALLHGDDARLHEMRAQVLLLLGRDYEAVQAAQRAAALAPDWPDAWLTLGRANLNMGEPQLALEALQRLSEVDPTHEALKTELPEAQLQAARHRQRGAGSRMQVVQPGEVAAGTRGGATTSGAAAASAGTEWAAQRREDPAEDPLDTAPMDGVDMTGRVYAPNAVAVGGEDELSRAKGPG